VDISNNDGFFLFGISSFSGHGSYIFFSVVFILQTFNDVVMNCILCGTSHKLEHRASIGILKLIESRYLEGPFVFPKLKAIKEEQCVVCLLCLNHIRKRKTNRQKQMLPMDHYLLGLLNPEFQSNLDTRSKKRIFKVLKESDNDFSKSTCAPLNLLIQSNKPVFDWWKLNLQTFFFKGSKTSRCVRINVKQNKILS